ncbi:Leucine Rich repeat [Carpediemonas membranifera]|uniref:Leucine Rich repeat n=1 Tax=Carpediemonas membranifera TaxID=201153 RepID=A0A8J6AQ87_9EUKA|nr:Leucine Rich repeat [Carpediemonas membranifera]|eukprot:KAG9391126.1 Leucine Rich repeat [Carpediemonas membranifera]
MTVPLGLVVFRLGVQSESTNKNVKQKIMNSEGERLTIAEELAQFYDGVLTESADLDSSGIIPPMLELAARRVALSFGKTIAATDIPEKFKERVERYIPVDAPLPDVVDTVSDGPYWLRRIIAQYPVAAKRYNGMKKVSWRTAFLEAHLARVLENYVRPPSLFPGGVEPPPLKTQGDLDKGESWPDTAPITRAFLEPGIVGAFRAASATVKTLRINGMPSHLDPHCILSRVPNLETFHLSYASRKATYTQFIGTEPAVIAKRAAPDSLIHTPYSTKAQHILATTPGEFDLVVSRNLAFKDVPVATLADCLSLARGLRARCCPNLTSLSVVDSGLTPKMATALCVGMKDVPLTKLDLSLNSIGDEGAHAVSKLLTSASKLEHLSLAYNKIGPDGARDLGAGARRVQSMRTLDLRANKLGDAGASILFSALGKQDCNVTTVRVGWNEMTGLSGDAIGLYLKKTTVCRVLDISGNDLGDEGGSSLLTALRSRVDMDRSDLTLDSFDMRATNIGLDVVNAILTTTGLPLIETLPSEAISEEQSVDGEA